MGTSFPDQATEWPVAVDTVGSPEGSIGSPGAPVRHGGHCDTWPTIHAVGVERKGRNMRRTLSIVVLAAITACSATPPDVHAELAEFLPERVVDGDETRATIVLDLDDLGYIDELHDALVALGFPASTVNTLFLEGGTGTGEGDGVVLSWRVDSAGTIRVEIERA